MEEYTENDLSTDLTWFEGFGVDVAEAESYIRTLLDSENKLEEDTTKKIDTENKAENLSTLWDKAEKLLDTWSKDDLISSILNEMPQSEMEDFIKENEDEEIQCPRCNGKMRIHDIEEPCTADDGKMPCPTCEGNGTITKEELEE